MLLYGQLQEGLLHTLMESPAVSGAQNYKELCIAAKREERRLAELKRKQQYLKPSEIVKQKSNSIVHSQKPSPTGPDLPKGVLKSTRVWLAISWREKPVKRNNRDAISVIVQPTYLISANSGRQKAQLKVLSRRLINHLVLT